MISASFVNSIEWTFSFGDACPGLVGATELNDHGPVCISQSKEKLFITVQTSSRSIYSICVPLSICTTLLLHLQASLSHVHPPGASRKMTEQLLCLRPAGVGWGHTPMLSLLVAGLATLCHLSYVYQSLLIRGLITDCVLWLLSGLFNFKPPSLTHHVAHLCTHWGTMHIRRAPPSPTNLVFTLPSYRAICPPPPAASAHPSSTHRPGGALVSLREQCRPLASFVIREKHYMVGAAHMRTHMNTHTCAGNTENNLSMLSHPYTHINSMVSCGNSNASIKHGVMTRYVMIHDASW